MNRLLLLLCIAAAGLSACESGWDVEGEVITSGVADRDRPIGVYLLIEDDVDPLALPTDASRYELIEEEATVPPDSMPFSYGDIGCADADVWVLAFAPAGGPLPPGYPEDGVLAVQAGDYFAFSGPLNPYCGWESNPSVVELTLEEK
jgi:hypothetical protein